MEFILTFKLNSHLYLKDPEHSALGKSIVRNAIELIHDIGFEQFTFRKLALRIATTEATIYRYFSSKHKLLVYILNWYWSYLEFAGNMQLVKEKNARRKLEILLQIIAHSYEGRPELQDYDLDKLNSIVVSESSKSYLVKEVDEMNKEMIFSPLKSFCRYIAAIILEIRPDYPYAHSLASTLLETAHDQHFFSEHLPSLTDNSVPKPHAEYVLEYLNQLAFSALK